MKPHFIAFLVLIFTSVHGQMSGLYTIGGVAPDFITIQSAIDSMESVGLNGPVSFNIRNGIYDEHVVLDSVPGNSSVNMITFQSETLDSSSVIITHAVVPTDPWDEQATFTSKRVKNLRLNELSFIQTDSTVYARTVLITDADACISHSDIQYSGHLGYPLNYSTANLNTDLHLDHSFIHGGAYVNCYSDAAGDSLVLSNNILSTQCSFQGNEVFAENNFFQCQSSVQAVDQLTFRFNTAIKMGLFGGNVDIHDNMLYGSASFGNDGTIIGRVYHNQIPGYAFVNGFLHVFQNEFDSIVDLGGNPYYVNIENNQFSQEVISSYTEVVDMKGNVFFGDVHFGYSDTVRNSNNEFHGVYQGLYIRHLYCDRNTFDTLCWCSYDTGFVATNNYFLGYTDILFSNSCKFLHNNFGPNGVLNYSHSCQTAPIVRYNNFYTQNSQDVIAYDPGLNPLHDYNNYYPCTVAVDLHPTFIDPQYVSLTDLHSTNPLLNARCPHDAWTSLDHDSVVRPNVCAMGANEVCLSNSSNDTIVEHCNDNVELQLCIGHTPGYLFSWSPAAGLSSTVSPSPLAHPAAFTQYVCTVTDSNAVFVESDTFNVLPDELPVAIASYYWGNSPTEFINLSDCSSSWTWYFGDGDSSNVFAPSHQYDSSGTYTVTLIACNAAGCDTFALTVTVWVINAVPSVTSLNSLRLYPVPSDRSLNISCPVKTDEQLHVRVFDLSARCMIDIQAQFQDGDMQLDTSALPDGMYVIEIESASQKNISRFSVLH